MHSMQHPKTNFPCKRAGTATQSGTAKVGSVGVGTDGTFDAGCVRSLRLRKSPAHFTAPYYT